MTLPRLGTKKPEQTVQRTFLLSASKASGFDGERASKLWLPMFASNTASASSASTSGANDS
eukprot:7102566-Prymnesium_polylepis.1